MSNPFLDIIILGTLHGTTTALLAMGFSLVYGVGGILNQSHGVVYTFMGLMVFEILHTYFFGIASYFFVAVLIALAINLVIMAISYFGLIKKVQDNMINVLIITLAIAIVLEQLSAMLFGESHINLVRIYDIFTDLEGEMHIGDLAVNTQLVFAFIVALITIIITIVAIKKLKIGQSIRAVSQDREAAELMGINSNKILFITIAISVVLLAVAVAVYLPNRSFTYQYGMHYLINAFAIVVIGGLGSLLGSVVGAYILAFASETFFQFIGLAFVSYLVPVVTIIIVLLIRPQGIFGKKEDEGH
ncbi:MAG: branched-chain amino acid ABC transporter permease [Promethearchaeota archaeon]